jgi:hypothetical protein
MTLTLATLQESVAGITGELADWSLETMLRAMRLSFEWNREYRSNIQGFEGVYVFRSQERSIDASIIFKDGTMEVLDHALDTWDIEIVFEDARAFWTLIFAGGTDVLDAILENKVEVYGNLTYLYKFGFMAKDLVRILNGSVRVTL